MRAWDRGRGELRFAGARGDGGVCRACLPFLGRQEDGENDAEPTSLAERRRNLAVGRRGGAEREGGEGGGSARSEVQRLQGRGAAASSRRQTQGGGARK